LAKIEISLRNQTSSKTLGPEAASQSFAKVPFTLTQRTIAPDETPLPPRPSADLPGSAWVCVAQVADVPRDGGLTIAHGDLRVAVFHFATRGEWWATQATCPHRKDAVLGRGLLGTQADIPKIACPLHKKTFSLVTGEGLADPRYCIRTYPVEIRDAAVWVKLPPMHSVAALPSRSSKAAASDPSAETSCERP